MTTLFWITAVGGAALLLVGIFADGALDFLDGEGVLSLPVIGAAIAAFGVTGLTMSAAGASGLLAALIGVVLAIVIGYFAAKFAVSMARMRTDPTPQTTDLVGSRGKIVTPTSHDRPGEALVQLGGMPTKLTAHADRSLPVGCQIVVVEARSSSAVFVMDADEFWAQEPQTEP
jgi:membrane protein implicated in regulation of membrane protease activity